MPATALDAVDGSHHRHLSAKVRWLLQNADSLLMAMKRLSGLPPATGKVPPIAEVGAQLSAIMRICFGLPPDSGREPRAPLTVSFDPQQTLKHLTVTLCYRTVFRHEKPINVNDCQTHCIGSFLTGIEQTL
jgi:hypothetical protein